ncbi:MAG: zinc ribbon domain-containing protein [Chloroflexia bacterium]
MSRISQLFDLQQIDSSLDSRVARMRLIDAQMVDSPELLAARGAHEEARALLSARQTALKRLTYDAEDVSTRLKAQEKRLYGGSIKNPKELSQVQEEVDHLKSRIKALDDNILDAMLEVEDAETLAASRNAEYEKTEQDSGKFHAGLIEEKDKLAEQAKVLQIKRQRAIADIPWADLQAYERLRRAKGGVAVAAVQQGLCGGCHVGVPAHVLRTARASAEFTLCPTCGRFLYPIDEVKFKEFDHGLDNIAR